MSAKRQFTVQSRKRTGSCPDFHFELCTLYSELHFFMAERVGFEPTLGFPKHAFQACAFSRSATSPVVTTVQSSKFPVQSARLLSSVLYFELCTMNSEPLFIMAEREGFEPPVELPPQQISSLPPSASSATSPYQFRIVDFGFRIFIPHSACTALS